MFCFSTGGEARAAGGGMGFQQLLQGKLCLSVDGQVWSKVVQVDGAAGTSSVVQLAVEEGLDDGSGGGGEVHDHLAFLGPRPVLEVAVSLDGAPAHASVPLASDSSQPEDCDPLAHRPSSETPAGGWRMYRKSRSVTVRPRFTLVNHSPLHLEAVQQGLEHWCLHRLPPQSARLFHWGDSDKQRHLRLRVSSRPPSSAAAPSQQEMHDSATEPFPSDAASFAGPDAFLAAGRAAGDEWSGALILDSPGSFPIRIPTLGGGVTNCKVEVRTLGAATYLVVEEESVTHPCCLLFNALPPGSQVQAHQHQCTPAAPLAVASGSSGIVCWDEPHMPHLLSLRLSLNVVEEREASASAGAAAASSVMTLLHVLVDVEDVGAEIEVGDKVVVHVCAHGPTRLVRVALASSQKEAGLAQGLTMAPDIDKMFAPGIALVRRTVKLSIAGVGVSLLDGGLSEVLYFSATGVKAQYLLGSTEASWEVKVKSLQLDNQSLVGPPVVLQKIQKGDKGAGGEAVPMLHVSIIRHLDRHLDWYRYLAVSLQEARLSVHETTLLRCLEMLQAIINSSNVFISSAGRKGGSKTSGLWRRLLISPASDAATDEAWWELVADLGGARAASAGCTRGSVAAHVLAGEAGLGARTPGDRSQQGQDLRVERRVYVETMHLHPVVLHLHFTPTGEIAEMNRRLGRSSSSVASVLAAVKSLNLTLPALEGASVCMNALLLSRIFASSRHLLSQVRKHYVKQYLKAVSPLEVLASKNTTVTGFFGGAMADMFYEPAQALVTSPLDFDAALQLSQQRVARTIGGSAAAVGHASRSLGSAITQLAGDGGADRHADGASKAALDFERGLAFRRDPDGGMGGGTGASGEDGPGGPALKDEGAASVLSGFSKGLWTGVLKPTAGMLDLASRSSLGIANAVLPVYCVVYAAY